MEFPIDISFKLWPEFCFSLVSTLTKFYEKTFRFCEISVVSEGRLVKFLLMFEKFHDFQIFLDEFNSSLVFNQIAIDF